MRIIKLLSILFVSIILIGCAGIYLTSRFVMANLNQNIEYLNKQIASMASFYDFDFPFINDNPRFEYQTEESGLFSEKGSLSIKFVQRTEVLPVTIDYGFLKAKISFALNDYLHEDIQKRLAVSLKTINSDIKVSYSIFPYYYDAKFKLNGTYPDKEEEFSLFLSSHINIFDTLNFSFDVHSLYDKNDTSFKHFYLTGFTRKPGYLFNTASVSGGMKDFDYAGFPFKDFKYDFIVTSLDSNDLAKVNYQFDGKSLTPYVSSLFVNGNYGNFDLLKLNYPQDLIAFNNFDKVLKDNKLDFSLDNLDARINPSFDASTKPQQDSFLTLRGEGKGLFMLEDLRKSDARFVLKLNKLPENNSVSEIVKEFFKLENSEYYSVVEIKSGAIIINGKEL